MKRALICLATLALAALPAGAQEALGYVNYQGLLTDSAGVPLASGTYDLVFRLYADDDGTIVAWGPEIHEETQVIEGRFNVILGSSVPLIDGFVGPERWLGVTVSPEAEITPRHQVLSTPYALSAGNGVPAGTVVMWWGDRDNIPYGWELCDGTAVTTSNSPIAGVIKPNMTDTFARGANASDQTRSDLDHGTPGVDGYVTLTTANLPDHAHTVADAFLFESEQAVTERSNQPDPPDWPNTGGVPAPTWDHEHAPFDGASYWGNTGTDTDNTEFVYRNTNTRGTAGAAAQPFEVMPLHQQFFFIIRVL
ncbi:hypothetical protein JXA47_15020 [Candidatus Sumerlaeota bacterium]|nr:hypothetical protein [Candidatus Sumerlaeota bacterium]